MPIRSASSSDLNEIRSTLREHGRPSADLTAAEMQHFLVCRADPSIDDRRAMLQTTAILPRHRLETEDGGICGVVGFEMYGAAALIRSLVVVPGQRGNRTGTRLLERIEQKALQEGAERLHLLTTSPEYFEDRGYNRAEQDAIPESVANSTVYGYCPPEAAVMAKRLQPEESGEPSTASAETSAPMMSLRNLVYTK